MAQAGGRSELPMEPLAQKLLVRSYFSVLGQAVLEGNAREEILRTMEDIQSVFTNGWSRFFKEIIVGKGRRCNEQVYT